MEKIVEPSELQISFSKKLPYLVLASSSPNRKALLESGGTKVTVYSPDVVEKRDDSKPIGTMVSIVKEKFESYLNSDVYMPNLVAIAADTLVLKDRRLLGKPKDINDARNMLTMLSGEKQTVLTAVALHIPDKKDEIFIDSAEVIFKELSAKDIEDYLSTGEWQGAAGGYRLQKSGHTLIDKIDGDWTTVVGLPLKAILDRA